ncbi:MAG: hypothetical protein L0170_04800, partial [Acidobacteria bacterium]|nr:hypothetical protein [Acidobacteriota bacterium]
MASPPNGETGAGMGRRSALEWLVKGFLSLWALGAGVVGIAFLKAPEKEKRPAEGVIRCGSFSALGVGEARFVRHGTEPLYV